MKHSVQYSIYRSVVAAMILAAFGCLGQGTLTITFDGPPWASGMSYYAESGMYFESPHGNNGFGHREPAFMFGTSGFPDNGTWYIYGGGHSGYNTVEAGFIDGSTFGLASIDVAGLSSSDPNYFAQFGAVRSDGSYLFMNISGTGIDFQTVNFGPEWSSGLVGFGISNGSSPDGWSVDNLIVIVPEPTTGALLLIGGLAALAFRKMNNVGFLPGLGWRRQRVVVNQYYWNAGHSLPPDGNPIGCINHFDVGTSPLQTLFYPPAEGKKAMGSHLNS